MNIYLDIDGVLLINDKYSTKHVYEFLKYLSEKHTLYWLTTHCRGNALYTCDLLKRFFDEKTMTIIESILPTYWEINKTEAIDFTKPFLWFDDYLFKEEKTTLIKNNCLNSWVEIDLSKDSDQLLKLIDLY